MSWALPGLGLDEGWYVEPLRTGRIVFLQSQPCATESPAGARSSSADAGAEFAART